MLLKDDIIRWNFCNEIENDIGIFVISYEIEKYRTSILMGKVRRYDEVVNHNYYTYIIRICRLIDVRIKSSIHIVTQPNYIFFCISHKFAEQIFKIV